MMYDELVKRLRELASIPEHCENVESCDVCSKEDICLSFTNQRIIEASTQAADAIEFLQTYKVAFENIVSMGGWWLVGQDKNLHRMNVPMNWSPKGTKTVELFPLPEPPEEEPTCKDCQRECQMIGLDMEACASYEPPKEETND